MYFIIMISSLLVLILTSAAVLLSRWIQSRVALPVLTAIAGYFPFAMEAQVSFARGFLILVLWTLLLSVLILWFSRREPERMERLIWRSSEYSDSMMRWIETGELPEGSARQVIFFHLKQTVLYCVLAFLSLNFLALVLGSALLNYMNFYVAQLSRRSSRAGSALWMGWNPWSVIRVLTFLYLGMVVSAPTMWLLFAIPWSLSAVLLLPAVAGLLLDLFLKLTLARRWSLRLHKKLR
ncbi:hypothetical protein L0156_01160 [bacterium]|nr:hypothetical protein [bacterium]